MEKCDRIKVGRTGGQKLRSNRARPFAAPSKSTQSGNIWRELGDVTNANSLCNIVYSVMREENVLAILLRRQKR